VVVHKFWWYLVLQLESVVKHSKEVLTAKLVLRKQNAEKHSKEVLAAKLTF
jgi:hypothetical protein